MITMLLSFIIEINNILSQEADKYKFIINRYIPSFDSSSEEKFFPYNCSTLDFIDSKTIGYVFDTASFYSWINIPSNSYSDPGNKISITNKYNEIIDGEVKLYKDNLPWIRASINKSIYYKFTICIPITIPNHIKNQIDEKIEITGNKIYNYLDYINDKISKNYINYIQTSINTGYILFGEKDKIFDEKKNEKEIKTCKCSHPQDNDIQNDFLNYWNCKISTFSIDNIKISSLYSKSTNGDIYAIFALSEEYIIAPKKTGEEIINYYRNLIGKKKCTMEDFNSNFTIMACQKFNFPELPDFTITLEEEISLYALSFDLFKNKNETHIYFKILLNKLDTKEYWYLGDPIIKNYNFLFDYNKAGEEKILIVASNKYNSLDILITSSIAGFISLLFFGFLLFARIKINILSKNKKKNQNEKVRKTTKKIKKIIRNQNDFDIPEGNVPIRNMLKKNNLIDDEDLEELKNEEENDNYNNDFEINKENVNNIDNNSSNNSSSNDSNNFISKSFGSIKDFKKKIKKLKLNENSNEYEMEDLKNENNLVFSDEEEGECEMIGDDEGSLPPLNQSK